MSHHVAWFCATSSISKRYNAMHAEDRVNGAVADLQCQRSQTNADQIPRFYFQKPTPSCIASHLHKACREAERADTLSPDALDRIRRSICSACERGDGSTVALDQAYLTVRDIDKVTIAIDAPGQLFSNALLRKRYGLIVQ